MLRLLIVLLVSVAAVARAGTDPGAPPRAAVDVYVFLAEGCPHCEHEIAFLRRLSSEETGLRVHAIEISRDPAGRALFRRAGEALRFEASAVPVAVIGDRAIVGYAGDATTGRDLRRLVRECRDSGCPDRVGALMPRAAPAPPSRAIGGGAPDRPSRGAVPPTIRIPGIGEIRTGELSLPALAVVLGAIDGFNPCAMWALTFLIGLLLGMKDRERMWVLGSAFIAVSAASYFLFMAAWLNLLLFVGLLPWVRLTIGLVALAGGFHYLREYFVNPEAVCPVTAPPSRRRILEGLKRVATGERFLLALGGILLLAFAVNLVELFCSAGIPAVYTQLLAMSALPRWQHHALLGLYVLVFMLDDLVVFVAAMITLRWAGLTTRYVRVARLVGAAALLGIGALMILRPEWLMFA